MSDNIDIKVQDKVDKGIAQNLRSISSAAREGYSNIERFQQALDKLKIGDGFSKLQDQLSKTAVRHQKLQTEIQRTQAQMANVEAALQRAVAAEARANLALEKLSAATSKANVESEKLAAAQYKTSEAYFKAESAMNRMVTTANNSATAAQRTATEQARTATALNNTATAAQRLQTEQAKTATAQQNTANAAVNGATAQTRLTTAQTNGATAAQRLATEQQRTATAAANAAAATTRTGTASTQATTAQQNLANAQARGAVQAQNLATAQARTATAQNQTAASADRAAIAALRLQQAQNKANGEADRGAFSFGNLLSKMASIGASAYVVTSVIKTADAYTTLQNKLQNVTDNIPQVQQLTQELFALADKTRTGVDSTATAFVRFDRSLKTMGKSQEDTLRMTETINKALIVSGATTQEASSALLQLSQAFNAGKLQGDEFRSVSENMPIVLDAVAKALNVPINQVKKLSSEGKITSEVLFNAFALIQKRVDEVFGKTTPTVAQSMQVLTNNWTKFVGELDKSLGVTKAISGFIMALSKNLDLVAAAAATAGAALLVYFGPALVGAITTATTATLAFTAAIAANPLGAAAVGITAAIAAFTLWGDKVELGESKLYNLQDVAKGVWQSIQEGTNAAGKWIDENLGGALTWLKGQFVGMDTVVSDFFSTIGSVAKGAANFIIGYFSSAFQIIHIMWKRFPDMMQGAFNGVLNIAATAVETIVNYWQKGLKLITNAISGFAPSIAESMNNVMDKMTISIPRLETKGLTDTAGEIANAVGEAFKKDYVGSIGDSLAKNAMLAANARRAAVDADNGTMLRGPGQNQNAVDKGKPDKAAEKRANALAKVNAQLDNEIDRMYTLQPMREAQQKIDQIEEQLIGKGIKLKKEELQAITDKVNAVIRAKEVQQQYDKIYEEAVGPARIYNATLEASKRLLDQGAISQEQYAGAVTKAAITYASANDPLFEFNRQMDEQLDLLKLLPKQREIEAQIQQKNWELLQNKGIPLNAEQIKQMRERLTLQQDLNRVAQEESNMLEATVGQRQQFADKMKALMNLSSNPDSKFTTTDRDSQSMQMLQAMGVDTSMFQKALDVQLASYQQYYSQLDAMKREGFLTDQEYAQARAQLVVKENKVKMQSWMDLLNGTAELQTSNIKELARIGKAAALAQAIINVYEGVTQAIAKGGLMGVAMGAVVIANGMAAVAKIQAQGTGFKSGGYTGNASRDQVVGNVHGQEFVMNAPATQRIGVENLQALQSGQASIQSNSGQGGGGQRVIMVSFDIDNNIAIQGDGQSSTAEELERAAEAVSKKTQADIMESMRMGSTWATVIKQAVS